MKKCYRIAELTVEMDSYGRTEEQAEPYQIDRRKEIDIIIQPDIERAKKKFSHLSDSDCEYLATGADFYKQLICGYNGFRLHASAIVVNNKAYLFSANSGVGKSTHTQLWLELHEGNAYILNDDKPALRVVDGTWYAYGTPWSGKHDISRNERVEIAGIAIVRRAEDDFIEPLSGIQAVTEILRQANKPNDYELRGKLMDLVSDLIIKVPIWKLSCTKNISAAKIAYEAMSGQKWEGNK